MGAVSEAARLRYLEEASKALTFSSPVVSSVLNASKISLQADGASTVNTNDRLCSGCAQYILPGLTGNVVKTTKTKRTRQDRLSGKVNEQRIRCSRCGTENVVKRLRRKKPGRAPIPVLAKRMAHRESTQQSQPAYRNMFVDTAPPTATTGLQSTTPAKRKARGKNASLQALLANKKSDAPKKGYGDLMDFMKT